MQRLLKVADYGTIKPAPGYKIYYHLYDAKGTWINYINGWQDGTVTTESMLARDANAVYFRIVVSYANNAEAGTTGDASITPADLPENAITLTEPVILNPTAAMFVMGTIDDKSGTIFNSTNRAYLKDALAIADYEKVTIASGWKAYLCLK
jgi:hypothetical protein